MVPPESIFGLVPTWVGVYLALAAAFALSGLAFYRRVLRLVRLGKPAGREGRPLRRLRQAVIIVLGQSKVLQRLAPRDMAGLGHALIFWGFISFLLSYIIFIFGDAAWRPFSHTLLTNAGVRVYASYLDIMALVVLLALGWAVLRRWAVRPRRLRFNLTRSSDAVVIVALIASLMLLTLLTEAFYAAKGGTGPEASVLVGSAMGRWAADIGVGQDAANLLQGLFWWLHLLIILGFAVYIPFSKHMHMVTSPPNAFFHDLAPMGRLRPMEALETAETFGAGRVQDFTWKELLDGYACAVCGRCTDSCPANISGKVLSPMHIVEGLKDYLLEESPAIIRGQEPAHPLIGHAVSEEAIWDCVTCGACEQECPVAVEHIDSIIDMRRHLVMEQAKMPTTAQNALLSMEQRGHPWRGTTFTRTDWAKGLDVKLITEEPQPEVLLWVGCTAALEERSQGVARAAASLLKRAGVRFAILGPEEQCTGDPARRMGQEYLFLTLAQRNIETLQRYGVKKVLTLCPHCFNTMKNEYPDLGGTFEVLHYTQFISQLIQEGRLKALRPLDTTVTYHDPCYLSRHNRVADEPREIVQAIPGLRLVEMERRRDRTFCCGAGGGHMWIEESRGRRINHIRTEHFLQTGAETVAVACPFCLQMFAEGIQAGGHADTRQVKDLAELLDEATAPPGAPGGPDQG